MKGEETCRPPIVTNAATIPAARDRTTWRVTDHP